MMIDELGFCFTAALQPTENGERKTDNENLWHFVPVLKKTQSAPLPLNFFTSKLLTFSPSILSTLAWVYILSCKSVWIWL